MFSNQSPFHCRLQNVLEEIEKLLFPTTTTTTTTTTAACCFLIHSFSDFHIALSVAIAVAVKYLDHQKSINLSLYNIITQSFT